MHVTKQPPVERRSRPKPRASISRRLNSKQAWPARNRPGQRPPDAPASTFRRLRCKQSLPAGVIMPPPRVDPVFRRPSFASAKHTRRTHQCEDCQGYCSSACIMSVNTPGVPSRVTRERGETHCMFCCETKWTDTEQTWRTRNLIALKACSNIAVNELLVRLSNLGRADVC